MRSNKKLVSAAKELRIILRFICLLQAVEWAVTPSYICGTSSEKNDEL